VQCTHCPATQRCELGEIGCGGVFCPAWCDDDWNAQAEWYIAPFEEDEHDGWIEGCADSDCVQCTHCPATQRCELGEVGCRRLDAVDGDSTNRALEQPSPSKPALSRAGTAAHGKPLFFTQWADPSVSIEGADRYQRQALLEARTELAREEQEQRHAHHIELRGAGQRQLTEECESGEVCMRQDTPPSYENGFCSSNQQYTEEGEECFMGYGPGYDWMDCDPNVDGHSCNSIGGFDCFRVGAEKEYSLGKAPAKGTRSYANSRSRSHITLLPTFLKDGRHLVENC
jgi:hypothetical protein